MDADLSVVGGGPAGAAAAISAARAGRRVVLVDKARFPRDKCCGDGLTAGALRELESLGLSSADVASWYPVEDVWLRSPTGHSVCLPLPRHRGTFAAVARRIDLDAALLDVAREAGVEVHDGHALSKARVVADGVELDIDGLGTLAAPYVIGADGMWSPLRKALGAGNPAGYLGEFHAFRQYFSDVSPAARQMWVWFEPDILPGYVWSFPLPDNRANVGFGIARDVSVAVGEMGELWPRLLDRPHIRAVLGDRAAPEGPHRAWPIPARVDRVVLSAAGGRALFVGDAACATDPLTGEGIAQALLTGRWAAEAVVAGGSAGEGRRSGAGNPGERYGATVSRELFADHRLSRLLSRPLHHRKGARASVRLVGATAWGRRNFARWLFEDYPRAILGTPHRWRRGALRSEGAYRS